MNFAESPQAIELQFRLLSAGGFLMHKTPATMRASYAYVDVFKIAHVLLNDSVIPLIGVVISSK